MPEAPIVEARAAASPVEPPAAPEGGAELPDELIQIPAVQGIMSGQPGAFSALLTDFEKMPEAKIIADNKDSLMKAGFGLYRTLDGSQGVIFNQLFISGDEIKAADQAGTLLELAPPFVELNASVGSSGSENPVLAEGERPTGFKVGGGSPVPVAPTTETPAPMPAGAQKTLASKRAANMQPGAPTSGASPGSGRLLNSILKPVL